MHFRTFKKVKILSFKILIVNKSIVFFQILFPEFSDKGVLYHLQ